jgi:hypothetical protein
MMIWANVKKVTLGGVFVGAMMLASSLTMTGCLTDDKKDPPKDTTTHTPLSAADTLTIGAQGHPTYGSVIDIDTKKALTSTEANAHQADIDLVFLFYGNAFHLLDAVDAKAAGKAQTPQINLTNSYDDLLIQHVDMVKVTTKPADQEAAEKAFAAATPIHSSVVVAGDMFLVQSTDGLIALVTISSITGSDKAAAAQVLLSIDTIL